jgi:anthranilate phosphoribosyltransferase
MSPGPLAAHGGWSALLAGLLSGPRPGPDVIRAAMEDVLAGDATPVQLSAFLIALRSAGETVEDVGAMLDAMMALAEPVPVGDWIHDRLVDTCGTGGDRSGTINVSTGAALVVAGAGVPVCKHGNRAASSASGSADVLEALGVRLELGPAGVAACVAEAGIGFCFAPRFHAGMRHAAPVRRELGVPTVFNVLGPLANPARVRRQVVGVSDPRRAELVLGVLQARGASDVWVVWGHDGLDELTTSSTSSVLAWQHGATRRFDVDPSELGLTIADPAELKGGDPQTNAEALARVLDGERGAHRDLVVLNAAAGLVVGGRVDDLAAGVELAGAVIDDGRAAEALERLVQASRSAPEG